MRTAALFFFAASLIGLELKAHEVEWWENEDGFEPDRPMVVGSTFLEELDRYIEVNPTFDEPCTVVVNVNRPSSGFISAEVIQPNPDNSVTIRVSLSKLPTSADQTMTAVTGEWHATGVPAGADCTATNPHPFMVPVRIALARSSGWMVDRGSDGQTITLANAAKVGLQSAESLAGPWLNVGKGTSFKVNADQEAQFFRGIQRLGGAVTGTVTDLSGKPQSGVTVGLPYGGPTASVGADGKFALTGLPWGGNLITMWKSMSFVDPGTGANRTETVGIDVVVPAINAFGALRFKVEIRVWPIAACNCTPWCAIGFGTLNGTQTPVYYAGGANPPKGMPPNCGQAQVTVTTPGGATFPVRPGTGRHQNSGANPASGTWTVTTTVCGQSKSCTVTVP